MFSFIFVKEQCNYCQSTGFYSYTWVVSSWQKMHPIIWGELVFLTFRSQDKINWLLMKLVSSNAERSETSVAVIHIWWITTKHILLSVDFRHIVHRSRTHIRDEPSRPDPALPDPTRSWRSLTTYCSNVLKDTNLKLRNNIVTSLKTVVLEFDRDIFIKSEVIAFSAKTDFCHFYIFFAYKSRTTV